MSINTAKTVSWRYALATLSLTFGLTFFAYWDTAVSFVTIWDTSETYTHGYVIVPIALYLVWLKRDILASMRPGFAVTPLLFLLAAQFVWLMADYMQIQVLAQLAFVSTLIFTTWAVLGHRVSAVLAFPLFYLYFAVPAGEFLTDTLIDYTAEVTVWAIQVTGIPVYVEGRFLQIPSGDWEVARACSGIRYLIASLALGTLYAYLTYAKLYKRILFVLMSIVVPVIANWVRAYGIVMIGHFSNNELATGVDHLIYGWFFFGLVILALFWVGSIWADDVEERVPADSHAPQPASFSSGSLLVSVLVAGIAISAFGFKHVTATAAVQPARIELQLPTEASGYVTVAQQESWQHGFDAPSATARRDFQNTSGERVSVMAVYYANEQQGRELIQSTNSLYDLHKYDLQELGRHDMPELIPGLPGGVLEMVFKDPVTGERQLVWSWYEVSANRTLSQLHAKILLAIGKLTGAYHGSQQLFLQTPILVSRGKARMVLRNFIQQARPYAWTLLGTGTDKPSTSSGK